MLLYRLRAFDATVPAMYLNRAEQYSARAPCSFSLASARVFIYGMPQSIAPALDAGFWHGILRQVPRAARDRLRAGSGRPPQREAW